MEDPRGRDCTALAAFVRLFLSGEIVALLIRLRRSKNKHEHESFSVAEEEKEKGGEKGLFRKKARNGARSRGLLREFPLMSKVKTDPTAAAARARPRRAAAYLKSVGISRACLAFR